MQIRGGAMSCEAELPKFGIFDLWRYWFLGLEEFSICEFWTFLIILEELYFADGLEFLMKFVLGVWYLDVILLLFLRN